MKPSTKQEIVGGLRNQRGVNDFSSVMLRREKARVLKSSMGKLNFLRENDKNKIRPFFRPYHSAFPFFYFSLRSTFRFVVICKAESLSSFLAVFYFVTSRVHELPLHVYYSGQFYYLSFVIYILFSTVSWRIDWFFNFWGIFNLETIPRAMQINPRRRRCFFHLFSRRNAKCSRWITLGRARPRCWNRLSSRQSLDSLGVPGPRCPK